MQIEAPQWKMRFAVQLIVLLYFAGSRSRGSCGRLSVHKYFCARIHAGPFDPWTLTFCASVPQPIS